MPKFTREIGETSFSAPVIAPVEDTSTAAAIGAVGGVAEQLVRGAKRVEGREAAEEFEKEVVAGLDKQMAFDEDIAATTPEGRRATLEADKAARKLAPLGRAATLEIRAEAKLKELLAKHSLFQEEVKQAFVSGIGFDPTGKLVSNVLGQISALEKAASQDSDQMAMLADRWGIIRDPATNPNWRAEVTARSRKEQYMAQYSFNKSQGEFNVDSEKQSMSVEINPETLNGLLVESLGIPRDAIDDPEKFDAFFADATEQDLNNLKLKAKNSFLKYKSGFQSKYKKFAGQDPEGFNAMLGLGEDHVEYVVANLDNKDLYQLLQSQQRAQNASSLMEVTGSSPELARNIALLTAVPSLAENTQFWRDHMQKAMDVFKESNSSNNTYQLNSPTTRDGLNKIFREVLAQKPDESFKPQRLFDPIVNASNMIKNTIESGSLDKDNQKSIVDLTSLLAQPNFAEWISSPEITEDSKDIIRRNFAVMQKDYLPSLVRDITEQVAGIPNSSIEVDSTGTFVIKGSSPELRSIRRSGQLRALNSAVKGITHLGGTTGANSYKSIAEGFLAPIQDKVIEERAEAQEPLKELGVELSEINKQLSDLKAQEVQSPDVTRKTKELENRTQEIIKEISSQTGADKVTLGEEEISNLRIAEAKRQFPDLDEEEIRAVLGVA